MASRELGSGQPGWDTRLRTPMNAPRTSAAAPSCPAGAVDLEEPDALGLEGGGQCPVLEVDVVGGADSAVSARVHPGVAGQWRAGDVRIDVVVVGHVVSEVDDELERISAQAQGRTGVALPDLPQRAAVRLRPVTAPAQGEPVDDRLD